MVIRGTEAARYLAMNDEGRLYGSVSKLRHLKVNQLLLRQNEPSPVASSAHRDRRMPLRGEAGGEPLQHLPVPQTPGQEVVRRPEKERQT